MSTRPRKIAAAGAAPAPVAVTSAAPPAPPAPRTRSARVLQKHDDKLTLILRTAALLFAEHGYDATSLDMIAEQLGMHKATLYHYIDGKESILFQCQLRSFTDLDEVEAHARDRSLGVLARLRYFTVHLARAQHNEFGRCLVLIGPKPLAEAAGGEIRRIQRRLDTIVRDLIKEGHASGELDVPDPALAGAMLFGALGWVPRWYSPQGRYAVDEIANAFFDLFERGIRGPKAAPAGPRTPGIGAPPLKSTVSRPKTRPRPAPARAASRPR